MWRTCLRFVVLLSVVMCSRGTGLAEETCSTQFRTTDTFGDPIQKVTIEVQKIAGPVVLKRVGVETATLLSLPCGDYQVTVSAAGMTRHVFRFDLKAARTWIPVSLQLGSLIGGDPPASLEGIINGVRPINDVLWVKLIELYSDIVRHAVIGSEGHFYVGNLRPSRYYLFILQNDKVINTRMIEVRRKERVEIHLK